MEITSVLTLRLVWMIILLLSIVFKYLVIISWAKQKSWTAWEACYQWLNSASFPSVVLPAASSWSARRRSRRPQHLAEWTSRMWNCSMMEGQSSVASYIWPLKCYKDLNLILASIDRKKQTNRKQGERTATVTGMNSRLGTEKRSSSGPTILAGWIQTPLYCVLTKTADVQ